MDLTGFNLHFPPSFEGWADANHMTGLSGLASPPAGPSPQHNVSTKSTKGSRDTPIQKFQGFRGYFPGSRDEVQPDPYCRKTLKAWTQGFIMLLGSLRIICSRRRFPSQVLSCRDVRTITVRDLGTRTLLQGHPSLQSV